MKRIVYCADTSSMSSIEVYRSSPVAMFSYRTIPDKVDLGIHCGSKLAAYMVATGFSQKQSYIDKLIISPKNMIDSDDCSGKWSQPHSINSMSFDRDTKQILIKHVQSGMSVREVLTSIGIDCIRYKNHVEDYGDYSYIVLNPSIIRDVENNALITFGGLFPDCIAFKSVKDLNTSDIVYFANGMRDTGICKYVSHRYLTDGQQYEIDGEVLYNLNFTYKFEKGQITNTFESGRDAGTAIITEIPSIFRMIR